MKFFELLSQNTTENLQLVIAISKAADKYVVTVTPKSAGGNWSPFTMTGTADELDQGFEDQIAGFSNAVKVISNAADYEAKVKAEAAAKAEKAKEDKAAKDKIADAKKKATTKTKAKDEPAGDESEEDSDTDDTDGDQSEETATPKGKAKKAAEAKEETKKAKEEDEVPGFDFFNND